MITGDRKKALWRHTASSAYVNCRWPFSRGSRADGRPSWYSLRSGSSMISCRVGHTNGSSRTGPGFSRIWESYRIFFVRIRGSFILHHLSSWLDINLQECSGSPPNRQRGKKVFTVRLRVGGKAKKTWLSVNFTSGFFLWACAVHIPKRNWLEKKINNVQSRTHPTPSFCIQPGFVRASFLEFVRFFFICLFLKLFCNSFFPFLFRTSVIILRFRSDTLVFVELYFLLYKFHIHGAPLLATESIMIFWKITFFSSALIHILSKM